METKENMVIASRLQKIYEEQSSFEQFRKSCIKEGIDEKQAEWKILPLCTEKISKEITEKRSEHV